MNGIIDGGEDINGIIDGGEDMNGMMGYCNCGLRCMGFVGSVILARRNMIYCRPACTVCSR
jgi:hypothetical protein